jgi:hypothetical protein
MKADELVEAMMRGLVKALVDVQAPVHPGKPPAKQRRPRRGASPPAGTTVVHADLPTPGFDQADEQLPLIPPTTMREMERAMEAIQRGNGVAPGFYDPNEADTRAPLS